MVLVVVPVRDEERNIGPCLEALSLSDYPSLRIQVVDDGSMDGTSEIVRRAAERDGRIRLMAAGDLPCGWLGKSHALWVGTRGAREDWLLFLDADVRVAPSCVGRAVAAAMRRDADLLTVLPRVRVVGFWEQAAQALVVHAITLWLDAGEINRAGGPLAGAIGPFMLFRRTAYEQIGGHQRVRGEVAEDLRLGEAIKMSGKRLVFARGTQVLTVRMYESLEAIVNGWSKNFHVALRGRLWLAPFAAVALVFFHGAPVALPLLAGIRSNAVGAAIGLATAVLAVAARVDFERLYGLPARRCYLAPIGALVVAWILLRSATRAVSGRPSEWKRRLVPPMAGREIS
jgi:cellulose synthase/poly-beta-1,6-N-acetylglucosamine synthase-like glycosyltransferase